MKSVNYFYFFLFLFFLLGCGVNKTNFHNNYQSTISLDYKFIDSKIEFHIRNPLNSPVRITLKSDDSLIVKSFNTITLKKASDTIFEIDNYDLKEKKLDFDIKLGDLNKAIIKETLSLPFGEGKSFKILQAKNGTFSHFDDYSRFAIDFAMKVNDTVFSSDEGYVVGVIDFNDKYGNDLKFKNYANYITVYNDKNGIYCQYVHLKKDKIFVKVGDKINKKQPIGLVGLSGFLDVEHLHFNALVPSKSGLKSIPVNFVNYKEDEMKKGMIVTN